MRFRARYDGGPGGYHEAVDTRTLALGDWSPVVRDPIDLLRVAYVVGVPVVALARHDYPLNLTVSAVVVVAARFLLLPRLYDLALCLAFGLTGWGDALDLYNRIGFYDLIVHSLASFFLAPVIYILLARAEVLVDLRQATTAHHYVGVFVTTLALGLAVGAVWEMAEFTSDHFFGSNLSKSDRDTVTDLMVDGAGSAFGGALLVVWSLYGWGSERRIPGEARREQVSA
jgi:hypothetical protein